MRPKLLIVSTLFAALACVAACRDGANNTNVVNHNQAAPPSPATSPATTPSPSSSNDPAPSSSPGGAQAPPSGSASVSVQTAPRAAPPPAGRTEPTPWRVLVVSGEWSLDGSDGALRRGASLKPRGTVRLHPAQETRAYMVLVSGSLTARKECARPDVCAGGWRVPDLPAAKSTLAHVTDAGLDLLSRRPEGNVINPISRGGGLREAVLLFEQDGVDLSPALGRVTPGRHSIYVEPLVGGEPVKLDFKAEFRKHPPLRAEGLRPGLYLLRLDSTTSGDAQTADAWVLVSLPETFRTNDARFRQAVAVTGRWGEAVGADVARDFLRAYLEHLAGRGANGR